MQVQKAPKQTPEAIESVGAVGQIQESESESDEVQDVHVLEGLVVKKKIGDEKAEELLVDWHVRVVEGFGWPSIRIRVLQKSD